MKKTLFFTLTALATPALAQAPVPVVDNAPVIDNQRVTVRDIALAPGMAAPVIAHAGDYVILYFQGGRIRGADGKTATHPSGGARFGHGGVTSDTALGKAAHEVVVELKDSPSNTVPNTTGLPPAFPRAGSKKILENDRVRVWNYTWLPGKPTPMHFHNTEVVVVYRGNGDVASTTPDGKTQVNHRNPGDIVFNLANRSHSEELVKGEQSGIMLELK
jgi:predicted metal-dependent enzyme (double-stranded beta helix superfamily)